MVMMFGIMSICILFISFLLFKKAFRTMNVQYYMPHMHMFYYQLVVMCLIGGMLLVGGVRSTTLQEFGVTNESVVLTIFSVWYVMIMIPLCCFIFLKRNNVEARITTYIKKESIVRDTIAVRWFWGIGTLISLFCVGYLYVYDAPIFLYLKGTIGRVLLSRVAYGREFEGSYFIKNVLGQSVAVMISYVTFVYFYLTKKRFWRNLFFIDFACGVIIAGASLSKAGIIVYIIVYIFLLVAMGYKFNIKRIVAWGCPLILLVILAYRVQQGEGFDLKRILFDFHSGPIGRILFMQIQSLPAYFMIFPSSHPFTWGKGIALLRFVGLPHVESARVVAEFLEPTGVEQGWVGVANTLFIGDAFANFGWIGVIISPVLVAFWFSFFYKKWLTSKKEPIKIVGYVMILDNLISSITGGYCAAYIINTKVIVLVCMMVLFEIYICLVDKRTIILKKRRKEMK